MLDAGEARALDRAQFPWLRIPVRALGADPRTVPLPSTMPYVGPGPSSFAVESSNVPFSYSVTPARVFAWSWVGSSTMSTRFT